MTTVEEATENLRMALEARQAMIDRVVADAERAYAAIIAKRRREYEDAVRREMDGRS